MPTRWPHTAAVLAGGGSVRMGRRKEGLPLRDGRSMIETVAAVLDTVAARVVVLGATEALPGVTQIEDLRSGLGPLGGIEALLASGIDTEYLVCPCDVPLVSAAVLRALLASSSARATVLHIAGESAFRPLPARFAATALDAVRQALGNDRRAVRRVIEELVPAIVPAPAAWSQQLTNVNTPEDYRRIPVD